MFKNTYQSGFLSILYSVGSSPLSIWQRSVQNGHIKRVSDEEVKSQVVEIAGTNVATTYIYCPQDPKVSLGVKLKFLVMIIKNLNKYFSFEITVLDNTNVRRRLRASNYQSTTRVRPFSCSMPMALNPGWNQVQFNLEDFTRRAYGTEYIETTRIQIHANCRIRRVYFADKLYTEDDVPPEYRLYVNDDPRNRRFSEPATAMTSAGLTAAAMHGSAKKAIDCSGTHAAPPTPCGGDTRDQILVQESKMRSFIGPQAPMSGERLQSTAGSPNERVPSSSQQAGSQPSVNGSKVAGATGSQAPVMGSKPHSLIAANSPAPVTSPKMLSMAGSQGPMDSPKAPSLTAPGSMASPKMQSRTGSMPPSLSGVGSTAQSLTQPPS